MDSDLDIEVSNEETVDQTDNIVYRAVRPDELGTLIASGALLPPCTNCPGNECCNISAAAHVTSGSRAILKSRWISTTKSLSIAALWSARKGNAFFSTNIESGRSSGIIAAIHLHGLDSVDPTKLPDIGVTGKNAAMASREILIKDKIPYSNIVGMYQAKSVTKAEYDDFKGMKTYGKKTKKMAGSSFVVIYNSIQNTDDNYLQYLKEAATKGLETRFVAAGRRQSKKSRRNRKRSFRTRKTAHKKLTLRSSN
jgi:hypothetical protein